MLAQPKRLAVLAYLAASTRCVFHSRDTLLALLWPGLDHEHARAALRQAVYVLRGALGDDALITCGDDVIGVDRERVWCDVAAFDHALNARDDVGALTLYAGELLAGFHVSGLRDFERWLDGERARLATRAATAARALSESAETSGSLTQALDWARRLLGLAPDDERALRRVIGLLTRLGDRTGAIRAYEDFARRIRMDFDMEPAPETQALISSVKSGGRRNNA